VKIKAILLVVGLFMTLSGGVGLAQAVTVDGFLGVGEYSHSFTAGWYNGHNDSGSQFQKADDYTTTVFWESTATNFYLYLEAPLAAKNMIWETGFTEAEALLYYQHSCSPDDGNPAALDGSNCDHHHKKDGGGFDDFISKKQDFGSMTGSEKIVLDKLKLGNLYGDADGGSYGNITLYQDSVDYVINNLGCDTIDCDANDIPMAFEFEFDFLESSEIEAFIYDIKTYELEFHLSPERGGPPAVVPEPSTYILLGSGLVGLGFLRRRFKK
jgi:hypothetical protein